MSVTFWPTGPSSLKPLAISIRLRSLLLWVKWGGCKTILPCVILVKTTGDRERVYRVWLSQMPSAILSNFLAVPKHAAEASEPVQCTSATVEARAAQVCTEECFTCCGFLRL